MSHPDVEHGTLSQDAFRRQENLKHHPGLRDDDDDVDEGDE